MWIHTILFLSFCVLFVCAKGFFSKSGTYLAGKIPTFLKLTKSQLRLFLMVVFWGNMLGFLVTLATGMGDSKNLQLLKRQEEAYTEELYVTDGVNREKITVEIGTEPYTAREKQQLLDDAVKYLSKEILGENQSLEKVEYPLNLITQIPGTAIAVDWDTDQPMILDWEGQIGEVVPKEGTKVHIQAELVLEDCRRVYETDVLVYPQRKSDKEQFLSEVEEQLQKQNEKQGEYLELPVSVNGTELTWSKADQYQGVFLAGIAVLIGVLLILSEKSRMKQNLEKRQMQMMDDYPGILNKMILLIQAGMSSRRAIQKIALDYQKGLENGKSKRDAYEEFLRIYREMEQGISEEEAYRSLGSRCELLCYRTLSTLLIQNLRKGSSYFLISLKRECTTAFEERKKRALVRGEEAGTKLLVPMMCMLLIVLLIILVPSMMTLG